MTDKRKHYDRFVSRVLDRIKAEGLAPRPRWTFLLSSGVFWTLGAAAVLLGAAAFSAGLFEIENAGWSLYAATHSDLVSFFFESAPFLWAVALGLFITIGYLTIRHTRRGYRYPLHVIAIGAVLTSASLGCALYGAGLGSRFEQAIGDHPPFYRPILLREEGWWEAPERGLIGGTVESAAADLSEFVMRDFSGRAWTVDGSDLSEADRAFVARGGTVRVIGVPATATSSVFHACFAFPWGIPFPGLRSVGPVVILIASTSATNVPPARSELCKGIRPYERLRAVDEQGLF